MEKRDKNMQRWYKILFLTIFSAIFMSAFSQGYAANTTNTPNMVNIKPAKNVKVKTTIANPHPHLAPITWKGKKWEYLVQFPRDIHHIDELRMEELMDDVGQHGWELVTVTAEDHYYAFYFKRPLLPHKIQAHRDRINRHKGERLEREAKVRKQIQEARAKSRDAMMREQALLAQIKAEKDKIKADLAKEAQDSDQLANITDAEKRAQLQAELAKLEQEESAIEKKEVAQEKEVSGLEKAITAYKALIAKLTKSSK